MSASSIIFESAAAGMGAVIGTTIALIGITVGILLIRAALHSIYK